MKSGRGHRFEQSSQTIEPQGRWLWAVLRLDVSSVAFNSGSVCPSAATALNLLGLAVTNARLILFCQPTYRLKQSEGHGMARYKLRYFFDGCTGTCLWSGNSAANEAFGYPVELEQLNLPDNILQQGNVVIDRFTVLSDSQNKHVCDDDWRYFRTCAASFLQLLRNQLGQDFNIEDESGTSEGRCPNSDSVV